MRIDDALARAAGFLRERQRADGSFTDFNVFSTPGTEWITGAVGLGFGAHAAPREETVLRTAADFLVRGHRAPGGWGFNGVAPVDADSTATCLRFLLGTPSPPGRGMLEASWTCLRSFQDPQGGGFATYHASNRRIPKGSGYARPSPCVTANAALALALSSASEDVVAAERAVANLLVEQEPSGAWRSFWWAGLILPTCMVLTALHMLGRGQAAVERALGWLVDARQPDGSWGDPFSTGLAVGALACAGKARERSAAEQGCRWLLDEQSEDGGWAAERLMRVPARMCVKRWEPGDPEPHVAALERVFTTAALLGALAAYRRRWSTG
ncbi:hypothetical protein JY651_13690 [Pyxidicoccus parkwayensis]|uniref:Squalene cyclase C-terminal domain-containing protein n=1 Tax=Pyxidicoccus parkwayensis TaxID=2813578 RepID=A0ABX7P5Z9_9BACT|nr:prenyltransferase/squalene oxidase repeat-containing protein [Pyxidicoccus parkwaysis]QSQ25912.1 hypothetical protein JY651_13690 [Pyxidicoccus parkwaysis]